MIKYEYKSMWSSVSQPESELNLMGSEGWELVGFSYGIPGSGTLYIFKRPLTNE